MKVLIACEESQRVCAAFRKRGHEAYSCDVQPPSGGHLEWHIQEDCVPLLNGNCTFVDSGGAHTITGNWDLIVAHPPCRYLTNSGNRWYNTSKYGNKAIERLKDREKAVAFFMAIANAECEHIAIENPIGYMNTHYRKADCIVHPYWFGDPISKATCFWLKNLPPLVSTNMVEPIFGESSRTKKRQGSGALYYARDENGKILAWNDPRTAVIRSKTAPGLAEAIAEQWGGYLENIDRV